MERCRGLHLLLIVLLSAISAVYGVRFDIVSGNTKCLAEELHPNAIVVGSYRVVLENAPNISVSVASPYGVTMHYLDNVDRGSFAFTATDPGNHMICMWSSAAMAGTTTTVELEWKTGVDAKDWTSIAKREKIDGIQLELRKLEDTVEAIHEEMLFLRDREVQLRNVNEVTNSRLAWLTVTSLFICLSVTGLQLWHLKCFFEKKKLL